MWRRDQHAGAARLAPNAGVGGSGLGAVVVSRTELAFADPELALQQVEAGLHAPQASEMLSYGALKLFPVWDPLRGDPRFEKIVVSLAPKENAESLKK